MSQPAENGLNEGGALMRAMRPEDAVRDWEFRLDGHEWSIERSIPDLLTGFLHHLARVGTIRMPALITDLREAAENDKSLDDGTRTLVQNLALTLEAFDGDFTGVGRIDPIYTLDLRN